MVTNVVVHQPWLITIIHHLLFNWVGGTISVIASVWGLYSLQEKVKNVSFGTKKSQVELLQSMLQALERDKPYDRLLIEYQFETIFGMRLSLEEIKFLVNSPSPLIDIRLRIKAFSKIKYDHGKYILLIKKENLKNVILAWSVYYFGFGIILMSSYVSFLATHETLFTYLIFASLFFLFVWFIYSPEYYSAKLFLSKERYQNPK